MAKGGYAVIVLALLMTGVESAGAQSQKNLPRSSITILLDLSYSMRLPLSLNKDDPHSPTRLDLAKGLLRRVIDDGAPGTQWSLFTFGGTREAPAYAGARIRQGYTADRRKLESEIAELSTWGTSNLSAAILSADRYSDREAPGSRRVLLVVSDGIDTMPSLFEMPSPRRLRRFDTRLVFAGIALNESRGLAKALESWARDSGGSYVDAADARAVEKAASVGVQGGLPVIVPPGRTLVERGGPPTQHGAAEPNGSTTDGSLHRLSGRRMVLVFIPLPLLLLIGFLRLHRKRTMRLEPPRAPFPVVRFRCEAKDDIEDRELTHLPSELTLGGGAASTAPLIEIREGRVFLLSAQAVLINGVAVRRAGLREGDRIRIGPRLWAFRGVEIRNEGPQPTAKNAPFAAAATAAAAVAALLILGLGSVGSGGRLALGFASSPGAEISTSGAVTGPRERDAAGDVAAERQGAQQPGPVVLAGTLAPVTPFARTTMIAPGEQPHFFKADIMFIHTHPDDDSIDFGGLMAAEARAGKRIVTVVFTDGNAGLDQFPDRRAGGIYPAHALKGPALASVRVQEAEHALSILGAKEYIRLGLLNNPYDSITEILSLQEVLRRWGGEERLVRKLAGLIEGFRPEIVVSPDEHHRGVFKHFEHEAVGYLTNRALSSLRARGEDFVRGHLFAVDPMLTSQYNGVFGVNVMAVAPRSGLTYSAIQVAALKEHATQRDASIIAVEVVPNFAEEYYLARSWSLQVPPERYFAHLTGPNGG